MPADFLVDTAVEKTGSDGSRFRGNLSESWAVWGPNGGYVAAMALRAAFGASRFARPASFHCEFLSVGDFGPVDIEVLRLSEGRRTEALQVWIRQKGRVLLTATAWIVDDGLQGFDHDVARLPSLPSPCELRGYQDLAKDYASWYPIWRSIEARPVLDHRHEPTWQAWLRFTGTSIADRSADALRQLFWLDFPGWNSIVAAHPMPPLFLAPNLNLSVQFHRFAPDEPWVLCEGSVDIAAEGLAGCVGRIWSHTGRLLATGTTKHLFRRNPNYDAALKPVASAASR